jgi:hypothetical protein
MSINCSYSEGYVVFSSLFRHISCNTLKQAVKAFPCIVPKLASIIIPPLLVQFLKGAVDTLFEINKQRGPT